MLHILSHIDITIRVHSSSMILPRLAAMKLHMLRISSIALLTHDDRIRSNIGLAGAVIPIVLMMMVPLGERSSDVFLSHQDLEDLVQRDELGVVLMEIGVIKRPDEDPVRALVRHKAVGVIVHEDRPFKVAVHHVKVLDVVPARGPSCRLKDAAMFTTEDVAKEALKGIEALQNASGIVPRSSGEQNELEALAGAFEEPVQTWSHVDDDVMPLF